MEITTECSGLYLDQLLDPLNIIVKFESWSQITLYLIEVDLKNQFQVLITIYMMRNFEVWGRNHELQAFSELYGVTIEIYDRITSTRARHIISCLVNSATIRLFFTGNHYDSLLQKNLHEQSMGFLKNSKKLRAVSLKRKMKVILSIERMMISLLMKSLMIVLKNISNQ